MKYYLKLFSSITSDSLPEKYQSNSQKIEKNIIESIEFVCKTIVYINQTKRYNFYLQNIKVNKTIKKLESIMMMIILRNRD